GALRVPLAGPVQPLARPGDRPVLPRRDAPRRGRQGGALLLHVRPEVLLDADHAGDPRGGGGGDGGEGEGVPGEGGRDLPPGTAESLNRRGVPRTRGTPRDVGRRRRGG